MQTTFGGLRHPPFSPTPDPRFFFASAGHSAALEALKAAAANQASPIVLTGPAGSGKTLLCRTMLRKRDPQAHRIYGVCRPDESQRLLDRICKAIKLPEPVAATPELAVQSIVASWKRARGQSDQPLLIVFDDAHHLDESQWHEIKLLSQADAEILVLLSGRPGLAADAKRFVGDSIGPKITIGPLPKEEARDYVRHRLHIAGAVEESDLFADMAVEKAHRAGRGIPAMMNIYLDAAMKNAVMRGLNHVDAQTMAQAISAAAKEITSGQSPTVETARSQTDRVAATPRAQQADHRQVAPIGDADADRTASRLDQASDRAERLAERLETISKAVEGVLDRVSVQSQRATALEKNLVDNVNRSEGMTKDLQAQIEKAGATYDREAERATSAAHAQLDGDVRQLDTRLDSGRALLSKLEAAERRIGDYEASVSKQADVVVGDIASHTATLMDRLDEVRGTVMDEAQTVLARVREEGKRVLAEWVANEGQPPAVAMAGDGAQQAALGALLEECRACLVDLQESVARAEDVGDGVRGTTEGIRRLVQDAHDAGRHVQQASTGAEQVVHRLEAKAVRAESAGEELEGTLARGVERIDKQQLKLTEQIARAQVVEKELRDDADSIRQEQSHFVHERQALESMIRDAASHTVEGNGAVQRLADQIAQSHSADRELTSRVQCADGVIARFESRAESAREIVQDIENAIEQSREVESRMKAMALENGALTEQMQAVLRETNERVESISRSAEAATQAAANAEQAVETADQSAALADQAKESADQAAKNADRASMGAAESVALLDAAKQTCHSEFERLEAIVVQASEAKREVDRSLEPAAAAIIELETVVEEAVARGDAITQAVRRHEDIEASLAKNVKNATAVQESLATECDVADAKTKQVVSLVQSLESATQRAAQAAEIADALELHTEQIRSLHREVEEAGTLAGAEADRACGAAANLRLMREEVERMEAGCEDALKKSRAVLASTDDRLESLQCAATDAVDKVQHASDEHSTQFAQVTSDAVQKVETLADERWTSIQEASADAVGIVRRIADEQTTHITQVTTDAVQKVETLADERWSAIQETTADAVGNVRRIADEQTTHITQVTTDAVQKVETLADERWTTIQEATSDAVGKVRNMTEEATAGMERRTTETFKRIEEAITSLQADMSAVSQERLRTAEHVHEMQQAVEQSEVLTQKAMQAHETIADAIMRTDSLVRKLADQREASRATLERQQSLHDQHKHLADVMETTVQNATAGTARLDEANALSGQIFASLSEQLADADHMTQTLREQAAAIDERRKYLDTAQAGMSELMDHVDSIAARMRQLQSQSDGLQMRIEQVINKPEQIAADARAQSEQLEQVARAVQKVFAGLSRSALDAKQKIDQFQEVVQTTDTRTRRLTAETSRSVDSLKAWVNEAVHAQSRLAETLNQCPPVSATHPGSVLQGLSRLADRESDRGLHSFDPPPSQSSLLRPPLELTNPGATRPSAQKPGVGAMPSPSAGAVSDNGNNGPVAKAKPPEAMTDAPSRAEEIQRLIEDARKFAESGV